VLEDALPIFDNLAAEEKQKLDEIAKDLMLKAENFPEAWLQLEQSGLRSTLQKSLPPISSHSELKQSSAWWLGRIPLLNRDTKLPLKVSGKSAGELGIHSVIHISNIDAQSYRSMTSSRSHKANALISQSNYAGTAAAWSHGWAWLDQLKDHLRQQTDRAMAVLSTLPKVRVQRPEATFLLWLDLRAVGPADPAAWLLSHGLGLSDGAEFDAPGFVRLNLGCSPKLLDEALVRLARAVTSLG
jgi:hypothetical protein